LIYAIAINKCTKHQYIHLLTAILKKLAHRKQQKLQKVILPASHWLCVNVLLNNITFCDFPVIGGVPLWKLLTCVWPMLTSSSSKSRLTAVAQVNLSLQVYCWKRLIDGLRLCGFRLWPQSWKSISHCCSCLRKLRTIYDNTNATKCKKYSFNFY